MFRNTLVVAAAVAILTPLPLWCADDTGQGVPTMREVVPTTAVAGSVVLVSGEYLDRTHVAEVYLTRGNVDTKVQITAQSQKELKFRVPADAEPGRYSIAVLMAGKVPMLLDQPVALNVKREHDVSTVK
jgi:hypothetical protein